MGRQYIFFSFFILTRHQLHGFIWQSKRHEEGEEEDGNGNAIHTHSVLFVSEESDNIGERERERECEGERKCQHGLTGQ